MSADANMPELWWSPSLRRFLSRHESQDDEHLVWVFHGHYEALRRYLGTGLDSNPPLPADAVRLVAAPLPLPDSETEWGWHAPWDPGTVTRRSEAEARRMVSQSVPGSRLLVCREVGPWKVVES